MNKIYILIRNDLSVGLQLAQAVHAAIAFCLEHFEATRDWNKASNNVAVLGVGGEEELKRHVEVEPFFEPDMAGQLTAAAFFPTGKQWKRFSSLPLAGKLREAA